MSARFGLRAENADSSVASSGYQRSNFGRRGFSIVPMIPLDGDGRRLLLEVRTNVELPVPEFVIGTDFNGASDDGRSLEMGIGGDVDVEVEEVNLIFSF